MGSRPVVSILEVSNMRGFLLAGVLGEGRSGSLGIEKVSVPSVYTGGLRVMWTVNKSHCYIS